MRPSSTSFFVAYLSMSEIICLCNIQYLPHRKRIVRSIKPKILGRVHRVEAVEIVADRTDRKVNRVQIKVI